GTAEELIPAGNMGVADVAVKTHTTPAGLTAEVAVSRIGGRVRQAETWFVQEGVLYHLYADVWGPEKGEAEIPEADFLAMLDSLHCTGACQTAPRRGQDPALRPAVNCEQKTKIANFRSAVGAACTPPVRFCLAANARHGSDLPPFCRAGSYPAV